MKTPTTLNLDIVNAQIARQILDILVGYKISPVLWQKIASQNLSAGRCQTPALRIIYDNQKEIDKSPGVETHTTTAIFTSKNILFTLNKQFKDKNDLVCFLNESIKFKHTLHSRTIKDTIKLPPKPFTTSKLQQASSVELHMSPKQTMMCCQKLYEAGLITYMRTDSMVYSKEFIKKALDYTKRKYGSPYVSGKYLSGEDVNNGAHEAIRPTSIDLDKLDILSSLKFCQLQLVHAGQ